jgi:hypothetical protein
MPISRIGGETIILYADLRERLTTFEAMRGIASIPGEFTTKTINGIIYHYFQTTLSTGRTQIYLGRDSEEIHRLITDRETAHAQTNADVELFERLGAQIMAGGIMPVPTEMARVIRRLADSGVFQAGGVLVGSIAFHVLGTHLGVHWERNAQMTQDIDLAGAPTISIGIPSLQADIPAALESLKMGFFPVPRLSHTEPSTSYAIRGKTLRIDILTPLRRGEATPVFIRRLNAAAQPVKYLDFILTDPLDAVMINGKPCLVKVPQPARFALHKLIVSQERGSVSADKQRKDIAQAALLLELLREDRPGEIRSALAALEKRGASWMKKLLSVCKQERIEL